MSITNKLKDIELINKDVDAKPNVPQSKVEQVILLKQKLNVFLIRYYNWLVILTAILIIAFGYFLLIQPKYREINSSKKPDSQNQTKQPYLKKQAEMTKFIELEQAYNKISKIDKEKIDASLPVKPDVEGLIAEIESIVLKNGLILTSLSIQQTEEKKSNSIAEIVSKGKPESKSSDLPEEVKLVKISLSVAGADYISFKNLLKTIENNTRLMDVKNIKYNGDNSGVSLDLIVYYFSTVE
ncbi:MAG: hypothetical protein V1649_00825 [Patescibacteria group bacterium]